MDDKNPFTFRHQHSKGRPVLDTVIRRELSRHVSFQPGKFTTGAQPQSLQLAPQVPPQPDINVQPKQCKRERSPLVDCNKTRFQENSFIFGKHSSRNETLIDAPKGSMLSASNSAGSSSGSSPSQSLDEQVGPESNGSGSRTQGTGKNAKEAVDNRLGVIKNMVGTSHPVHLSI